jgi:uncharacterized small protein (DUF1192 family)
MCAFNREDHRVDGKLHCWLCKLSYKRALAKAKKTDGDKQRHKKRSADEAALNKNSSHKMSNSGSSNRGSGNSNSQRTDISKASLSEIPEKIPKTANSGMIPSNSDHVVAITQLREQIATLQKKLQQKDAQLLQKDKEVSQTCFVACPLTVYDFQSIQHKIKKIISQKPSTQINNKKKQIFTDPPSTPLFSTFRSRNGRANILRLKRKCEIE